MTAASLPVLWANCVDRLKDRVVNRSFWEALEMTQPITIEDDTLIIGLDAANFNRASHIQQSANMRAVTQTVEEFFRQPLQVRLIEGTTLADWETTKEREAQIAAMREQAATRQTVAAVHTDGWDGLLDQVARLYAQIPNRAFPQNKARYLNEALYLVVEAMDSLYPDNPDETAERGLARVLERIAGAVEIPAPIVAFELERLRAWRKAAEDS